MDWTLKTCMQPNNGAAHDNYLSLSHIDDHEFFVRVHGNPMHTPSCSITKDNIKLYDRQIKVKEY